MKVGYQTEIEDIGNLAVYQVFLGNPSEVTQPNAVQLKDLPNEVVIHCPYWTNITRGVDDPLFGQTLNYCIALANTMSRYGVRYFVLHVGSRFGNENIKDAISSIKRFCLRWLDATRGLDVVMCLENDAGSKRGRRMGSVNVIHYVLRDLNSSRVRMCLDTEHLWANGVDLNGCGRLDDVLIDFFRILGPYVAVVHLNGAPKGVGCGSHVDCHHGARFDDSAIGLESLLDVVYLFNQISPDIPFIMECDKDVAEWNLSLLKENGVNVDSVGEVCRKDAEGKVEAHGEAEKGD